MFKWGARKQDERAVAPAVEDTADAAVTSKVLPRVLATLSGRPSPVLLDLGPVVGANVGFFGDRLACKIHVEDLFADVEAQARKGDPEAGPPDLAARLTHLDASIDGVLVWDLFDVLDKPTSQALAGRLAVMLRPGGVLYGFFGTAQGVVSHYTRFIVETDDTMRQRPYPATPAPRNVLTNRDINRMFEGLEVVESVLLKSQTRETLFRKPS